MTQQIPSAWPIAPRRVRGRARMSWTTDPAGREPGAVVARASFSNASGRSYTYTFR